MATVHNMVANLTARTSVFERGMKRANGSLGAFTSKAKAVGGMAVKGFAIAGAAAIGVGAALAIPTKRAMDSIDKMGKLSDSLNITTEALGGLKHGANITGTSFEQVTKGITKMHKGVGDALQNLGTAKVAFDQLGLSANKLKKMSTEDQFSLIADKISTLPTTAEKASAAMGIFGRSGMDMMNLLNQGADGIEGLRKEADELGLTFNRLDAAQIEAANDSITRLKALFQGVINKLAIALAPYIQLVSDHFVEMGKEAGGATEFISKGLEKMVRGIGWVIKGVQLIKSAFWGIVGVFQKVIQFVIKGFEKILRGAAKVAEFFGFEELSQKINNIGDIAGEFSDEYKKASSDSFDKSAENFMKAFGEDNIADGVAKQIAKNKKKIELQLGKTPATPMESATTDTTKKAKALEYSSAYIDVAALSGASTKDPMQKKMEEDVKVNRRTAIATEKMAQNIGGGLE